MKTSSFLFLLWAVTVPGILTAQNLKVLPQGNFFQPSIQVLQEKTLSPPAEGLWSIATAWEENWPADWQHAAATAHEIEGPWHILKGKLSLPQGDWILRDAYKQQKGRIQCIRRWEWQGDQALDSITLSVRWQMQELDLSAFMPGILYYGNPSGEKNGAERVPYFHGQPGEEAIFEEHRFPMPFVCLEGTKRAGVLHSQPSPVAGGNIQDQWWSLGTVVKESHTELQLLSGPVAYNGQRSVAKAQQRKPLPYGDTYLQVQPGTIIEKTFYLEAFRVTKKGTAFQRPIYSSLDIFHPYFSGDMPTSAEIIEAKYRFAKKRWIEGDDYAGFNMYPAHTRPRIVLGWAGQSEAPAYALQVLAPRLQDPELWSMVQRSLDHICTTPIGDQGFPVRYEVAQDRWERPDPVSEGQAMHSIALAIKIGRDQEQIKTEKWEAFLQKACDIHAKRIVSSDWEPINTAEAFYIAPMFLASDLFRVDIYREAALKMTEYYGARHLDMTEPYWGGTLDAICEDKEGAWGALQGFWAAFEFTGEEKYLSWARHAHDVVISYTVVWDIPLPPGRMADHAFKTRGWTGVSPQNQHLDVYGVVMTPTIFKLGQHLGDQRLMKLAELMYRSCGQMIDPTGAHGEQLQQTNYAQHGDMSDVYQLRGGYSEQWTVFWITATFCTPQHNLKSWE